MSTAGAQVASDQISSLEALKGSKPSKKRLSLSSNGRKGSNPINSRAPFTGAKPAPLLFAITLPPLLIISWLCNTIAKLELRKCCAVETHKVYKEMRMAALRRCGFSHIKAGDFTHTIVAALPLE